jgi:hypothetical protein
LADAYLLDDGDGNGFFASKKFVMVIDMWPVGAH